MSATVPPESPGTAAPPELAPARLARALRHQGRRSSVLVFLVLLAVYATGLGVASVPGSDLRPSEARVLLTSESLVSGSGLDLSNEYRTRAWRSYYDGELKPNADTVNGRLLDPQGMAFPAFVAPAYAIGGRIGVELFLAAIAALGFAVAAALGRRLVPDPWATGSALAVGLSPPAVLAATTITPVMTCAALIAGAAVLALRVRDDPHGGHAIACGLLLAPVVWLYPLAVVPAAVVAVALFRWLRRRRRAWTGIAAIEIPLISLVVYVSLNGRLYGGLTPYSAEAGAGSPTRIGAAGDIVDRLPRIATLWLDPLFGVLVYAPFLGLGFASIWLLWRSRRDRLARAFPGETDVEVAAGFLAAICAAAALAAIFLLPSLGSRIPGEAIAVALPCAAGLCAWALRRWVRVGIALALIGIVLSGWMLVAARTDSGGAVSPPARRRAVGAGRLGLLRAGRALHGQQQLGWGPLSLPGEGRSRRSGRLTTVARWPSRLVSTLIALSPLSTPVTWTLCAISWHRIYASSTIARSAGRRPLDARRPWPSSTAGRSSVPTSRPQRSSWLPDRGPTLSATSSTVSRSTAWSGRTNSSSSRSSRTGRPRCPTFTPPMTRTRPTPGLRRATHKQREEALRVRPPPGRSRREWTAIPHRTVRRGTQPPRKSPKAVLVLSFEAREDLGRGARRIETA